MLKEEFVLTYICTIFLHICFNQENIYIYQRPEIKINKIIKNLKYILHHYKTIIQHPKIFDIIKKL